MEIDKQETMEKDEATEYKDRCPGCNKIYDSEAQDHVQYTKLSCGHSLCTKCIEVQWCNSASNDAESVTCEVCQTAVKISHDLDTNVDKDNDSGSLKLEMSAFLQKQINKALLADTEQTLPQNVQTYESSALNKIHSVSLSPNSQRTQRLPTPVRQTPLPKLEPSSCNQNEDSAVSSKSPQIELGDEFLKFMAQQDEEHLEQLLYTLGCSPIKVTTASLKAQKLPSVFHSSSTDCPKCLLPESPTNSNVSGHPRHLRNLPISLCCSQSKFEKPKSAGRHVSKQTDCSTLQNRTSSKYSKYKAFSRSLKFDTQNLETLSAVASIQDDLDSSMPENLLHPPPKVLNKKDASNKPKSKRKSYALPRKTEQQSEVKPDTRCVHVLPQTSGSDSESNSCDSQTAESKFGVLKKQVMPDGSNIEHLFLVPSDWLSNKVDVKIVPTGSASPHEQEQAIPNDIIIHDTPELYDIPNSQPNAKPVSGKCHQVVQTSCGEDNLLDTSQEMLDCDKTAENFEVLCTRMAVTSTDENESGCKKTKPMDDHTNIVLNTVIDAHKVCLLSNNKLASKSDVDHQLMSREQIAANKESNNLRELTKDDESSDQLTEYDGVLISGNEPCVILMTKNLDCIDETVSSVESLHPGQNMNDLKLTSSSNEHLYVHKSRGQQSLTEGTIAGSSDSTCMSCETDGALLVESKRGKTTESWSVPATNCVHTFKGIMHKYQQTQLISPTGEPELLKTPATNSQLKTNVLLPTSSSVQCSSGTKEGSRVTNSNNLSACKSGTTSKSFITSRGFSNYSDVSSASNACSNSSSYTSCESDFSSPLPLDTMDTQMKHLTDINSHASSKRSHLLSLPLDHPVIREHDQRWKCWRSVSADENCEKVEYTLHAVSQKATSSNTSNEDHTHLDEQFKTQSEDMQCLYYRLHPEFLLKELENLVSGENSKLELTVLLRKLSELHEIINLRSSGNSQMVFNESLISCESEKELFYGIMMAAASVISFVKAYQVTATNEGKTNQSCTGLLNYFDEIIRHGVIVITKMLFGYNHLLYTHQDKNNDKSVAAQNQNVNSNMPCGHEEQKQMNNQAKFHKFIALIREIKRAKSDSNLRCENTAVEQTMVEIASSNNTFELVSTSESNHDCSANQNDPSKILFNPCIENEELVQDNEINTSGVKYSEADAECSFKCIEYDKSSDLDTLSEIKSNGCDGFVQEGKVLGIVSDVALNVEVGIATVSSDGYQSDDSHIPLRSVSTPSVELSNSSLNEEWKPPHTNSNINKMQKSNKMTTRKTFAHEKISRKSNSTQISHVEEPCVKKVKNGKLLKTNMQGCSASCRKQKNIVEFNERKRHYSADSLSGYEGYSSNKKLVQNNTEEVVKSDSSSKASRLRSKTPLSKTRLSLRRTSARKRRRPQFSKNPCSSSSEEVIRPLRRRGFQHTDKCYKIFTTVFNNSCSDEFCNEILSQDNPDYYKVVKRGMWLNLIAQKLRQGIYETLDEFVDDFRLVFKNCRVYHPPESETFKSGEVCSQLFEELLKEAFPDKEF